jgi:hypothetical protein
MSDEEPKTYKQQLKNYFYGPPVSWDMWLPNYANSFSIDPESFQSPYEAMTSTDPWLCERMHRPVECQCPNYSSARALLVTAVLSGFKH